MGPSPRYASIAYDSASKKVTLFGGASLDGGIFNDTWEWNDQLWTQVADTGPLPRAFHKMVYDSKNSKMILFGGLDITTVSTVFLGDTWRMRIMFGLKFKIWVLDLFMLQTWYTLENEQYSLVVLTALR
jgi:Galactose oxidase, central domain